MEFFSDTVQIVIFSRNKKNKDINYLLLKRSDSDDVYPGIWQVCTGTSVIGEASLDTALREVQEETGINAYLNLWLVPKVASYFSLKRNAICFSPIFAIEIESNFEVIISEEHSEYLWVNSEKAKQMLVIPSHKESIKYVEDYIINDNTTNLFKIKKEQLKTTGKNE
jgi:8-oxo-dGTP pyrophosphatase MutT (NUDIX family)